ncbi:MAG: hypothetical protein JWL77_2548 [Chthonomonadaceae bacterium]|nr:hypothetical protein [Chthonomonadaceae bacterium]
MRVRRLKERLAYAPTMEHVGGTKIKSLLPVEEEWFCLQIAYDSSEPPRLFLSRVALWALVEEAYRVDRVIGIDATGIPQDDPFTDVHYLYGGDISPNGSAWRDVYRSVKPSLHQVREVTHLFESQA